MIRPETVKHKTIFKAYVAMPMSHPTRDFVEAETNFEPAFSLSV